MISVAVPSQQNFSTLVWTESILSILSDENSIFKFVRLGVDVV